MFHNVQALNPASEIRKFMDSINIGGRIVAVIFGICVLLSVITLFIAMLAAATERNKDVALLRVLGAKRKTVFQLVVIETFILSCIGCCLGFILSRVFMFVFSEMVKAEIGLNFSALAVSSNELMILAMAIFLCTIAGLVPGIVIYKKEAVEYL